MVEWSNHVKLHLLVVFDLVCVILCVIVDSIFFFAESNLIPGLPGPKFALVDQLLILWSLDCHPSIWTIAFFFYFICPLVDSWFRLLRLALTFQISFWAMGHRTHYRMLHIPREKKRKKVQISDTSWHLCVPMETTLCHILVIEISFACKYF